MTRRLAGLTVLATFALLAACSAVPKARLLSSAAEDSSGTVPANAVGNCTPLVSPQKGGESDGTKVVAISFPDQACTWFIDVDEHFGGRPAHVRLITCSEAGYGRSGRGDVTIGVREVKQPGYERDRRHGITIFRDEKSAQTYRRNPNAPTLGTWRFSWE